MPTLETIATRFARCVDLFRDPAAKEAQKAEFRALMGLLKEASVTLRVAGGRLEVNGVPSEGKAMTALLQRFDLHGVAEIALPPDPPPAQLFELLRVLADQPSLEDVPARLGASGADSIRVTSAGVPPAAPAPPAAPPSSAAARAGAAPAPSPPPAPGAVPGRAPPADPIAAALAELERNPEAAAASDALGELVEQAQAALKRRHVEQLLRIVEALTQYEGRVPDGSSAQRSYSIALRRVCSKAAMVAVTRFLGMPKHRAAATLALQRGGAEAVGALIDVLVAAPSMGERRAVFDALTQMTQGTDQLVQMLDHPEWFVVRNVAELVGELGMEDAIPALSRHLDHEDERVRKAVALALAKIGSRGAAEPLRRALRDRSTEVRMQVALGIGGRKSSALAMPLVVAMDEETDEAVQRELVLALGRIGSADAVQALIKIAQPSGRIFGRKPSELRVAAVDALRLAGTPAAVGTLQGLSDDSDKQVRATARAALKELKHKPDR